MCGWDLNFSTLILGHQLVTVWDYYLCNIYSFLMMIILCVPSHSIINWNWIHTTEKKHLSCTFLMLLFEAFKSLWLLYSGIFLLARHFCGVTSSANFCDLLNKVVLVSCPLFIWKKYKSIRASGAPINKRSERQCGVPASGASPTGQSHYSWIRDYLACSAEWLAKPWHPESRGLLIPAA